MEQSEKPCVIELDLRVVRLAAIKKAAYQFGGRCFVQCELVDETHCHVTLQPKHPGLDLHVLQGQFQNAALDQELREVVAVETGRVRDLLLAQALSGLALTDPIGETASPDTDPLGIRSA